MTHLVKSWIRVLALLIALSGALEAQPVATQPADRTFTEWRDAISKLPPNRTLNGRLPPRNLWPIRTATELQNLANRFISMSRTGFLAQGSNWVGSLPPRKLFFDNAVSYHANPSIPFLPFAQRLSVPVGSEVIFHGDLHGDVRSLVAMIEWLNKARYMDGFTVIKPRTYLVFLGDFVDRGLYGVETMYTLLRLRLENPDNVFLARGNHEDIRLVAGYGFLAEAQAKFGDSFNPINFSRIYDFMPPVIYTGSGTNFLQCCHGGMEPGYNPSKLLASDLEGSRFELLGTLKQAAFVSAHAPWLASLQGSEKSVAESLTDFVPTSPTTPSLLGFMWNDFTIMPGETALGIDPGRGFVYGKPSVTEILKSFSGPTHRLHAVFRAHQHSTLINPMMRRLVASDGIFRHWQEKDGAANADAPRETLRTFLDISNPRPIPEGSVWTFNVVPDSFYGVGCDYTFDTFGILTTAARFEDWRLKVVNQEIKP